ncbi:transposase family protein [Streptomyces sp. NPDC002917]|uniref:transposase family protein n=1 Tax=Streptomyces sp. NPDC002917 TaxID=3364671 RepID=UPI003675012A
MRRRQIGTRLACVRQAGVGISSVEGVLVESVDVSDTVVRVEARTTASRAACPGCGCWSDRIHGSYLRFPRDLPAVGKFVVVSLRVRRFVCAEKSSRVEHLLSRCRDSPAGSVGGPSGCDRRCSRSALPSQAQRSRKPDRYRPLMRQARICESRMRACGSPDTARSTLRCTWPAGGQE